MKAIVEKIPNESGGDERSLLPLLYLAENAIYTAKNHYKQADLMKYARWAINTLTTASLFAVAIPFLQPYPMELQTTAVFASMLNLLLVSGCFSIEKEKAYFIIADSLRCLYTDAIKTYTSSATVDEKLEEHDTLNRRFEKTDRRQITALARRMAKWSLEHENPDDDEVDLQLLRNEKRRLHNGQR